MWVCPRAGRVRRLADRDDDSQLKADYVGPEVLPGEVRDALAEDAGDQVGSSLPRQSLPEVSVRTDVPEDREHGLEELDLPSGPLLGRVLLGGQAARMSSNPARRRSSLSR
jgi:hypothetical protein